jgi:hypothetical protein
MADLTELRGARKKEQRENSEEKIGLRWQMATAHAAAACFSRDRVFVMMVVLIHVYREGHLYSSAPACDIIVDVDVGSRIASNDQIDHVRSHKETTIYVERGMANQILNLLANRIGMIG